jgi:hypothetical protein
MHVSGAKSPGIRKPFLEYAKTNLIDVVRETKKIEVRILHILESRAFYGEIFKH